MLALGIRTLQCQVLRLYVLQSLVILYLKQMLLNRYGHTRLTTIKVHTLKYRFKNVN